MPNAHSHAFQRALRGRGEAAPRSAGTPGSSSDHPPCDDFWTWRNEMFALASLLDPDRMYALALGTYAAMAAAGYGLVGEFHYVHHQADGTPYTEPNAMAHAVADAARETGLEIVLLPAAYHRSGWCGRD